VILVEVGRLSPLLIIRSPDCEVNAVCDNLSGIDSCALPRWPPLG
jgi:hypothetical protein